MTDLTLTQMLNVKICHDLAGLAGAISNGAEIFAESSDDMKASSFELIASSAKDITTRIILFRKAFGTASDRTPCEILPLQKNITDYAAQKKVNVHWKYDQTLLTLESHLAQILANTVLVACDTLMLGGKLTIQLNDETKPYIKIAGHNSQYKMSPTLLSLSQDQQPEELCNSRNVVCFYLQQLLEAAELSLHITTKDDHFTFIVE